MRMSTRLCSAFVLLFSASVAAQSPATTPPPQREISDPKQTTPRQATPIDAKEFITTAADSGKAEVALSTLAEKKAQNDRVRQFAAMLRKDHSAANSQLTDIASGKKVTVPDMSPEKKAVIDRFNKMDTGGFDRAYMAQMIEDHKKSVDLFTRGTASPDADVKNFATRTLPTIKMHLSEAEQISKNLGPSSAPRTPPAAGQ